MNEQPQKGQLSTADMAAAAEQRSFEHERVPEPVERTEPPVPSDGPSAASRMERSETQPVSLLSDDEAQAFRSRWDAIQTGFVDEPRQAVEQADALVAEVMKRLAEVFADERANLETHWSRGDDVDTEDLRLALRRYRSFFDRLLSV
ncbi:MAG: hypothetical protein M5U01_03935 [Ardenticatenaceae bacterium]|nr:hypothetical protein [Ardenticatenaceae bacterium]